MTTTTDRQPATLAIVPVNRANVPLAIQTFGEERLDLLKEQLGRGWKQPMTDAELEHIAVVCQRTRLEPLAKPAQIYFIQRKDSALNKYIMTPQVSIDGLRLMAKRSREYGGQTPYMFCGTDGQWTEVWLAEGHPAAAKVGMWRKGRPAEVMWTIVLWSEWAQYENEWGGPTNDRRIVGKKLSPFWESKPSHMLGKTCEGLGLKRFFPEETNDLELARVDQDWQQQAVLNARRYDEIMGNEQDGTAYDLPQPALSAPVAADVVVLNAAGQTVNTGTGEVLDDAPASIQQVVSDVAAAPDVVASLLESVSAPAARPAVHGAPVEGKMVTSIDDDLYQRYVTLTEHAGPLEVEFEVPELPMSVVEMTRIGKALAAKIVVAKAKRDQPAPDTEPLV